MTERREGGSRPTRATAIDRPRGDRAQLRPARAPSSPAGRSSARSSRPTATATARSSPRGAALAGGATWLAVAAAAEAAELRAELARARGS